MIKPCRPVGPGGQYRLGIGFVRQNGTKAIGRCHSPVVDGHPVEKSRDFWSSRSHQCPQNSLCRFSLRRKPNRHRIFSTKTEPTPNILFDENRTDTEYSSDSGQDPLSTATDPDAFELHNP